MNEIEVYVEKVFKKIKLDKIEKKDLKIELIEHLSNIKEEYVKSGMSEKDAVNATIKNFNLSEFSKELNNFSINKKLVGFNLFYLIKVSLTLLLFYIAIMSIYFSLFEKKVDSMVLYFPIICLISIGNCYFAYNSFESKKDMILHISLIFLSFFSLQFICTILIGKIYNTVFNNSNFNIFNSYLLSYPKIMIYFIVALLTLIFVKFSKFNTTRIYNKLSNLDLSILLCSLILNIIYFLYPNRFNILKRIVYEFFNVNVQSFNKNFFYMNINNDLIIINIGFLMLILFIVFKLTMKIINKYNLEIQ